MTGYIKRKDRMTRVPVGTYPDYKTADLAAGTWLKSTPGAKEAHIERVHEETDE